MKRRIFKELQNWKNSPFRKPLMLRGARQIGKTYCVRSFAKHEFEYLFEINFEINPEQKATFENLDPKNIINQLKLTHPETPIHPGKTLLFLDEIQECPKAIMALRYFKEMMPELHVIAAGSLLEFTLQQADFRMPVGRVEYRFMYPMSFQEFLWATGYGEAAEFLETCSIQSDIPLAVHHKLCELTRAYLITGGLPEVVAAYKLTHDYSDCKNIQTALINTYRNDFGKYTAVKDLPIIEEIFRRTPEFIGQQFTYSKISPEHRARDLKTSLNHLIAANLLISVTDCHASGLPLLAGINRKRFKMLFFDTGLATNISKLSAELLLQKDFFAVNRGAIMEQFVGQELLAYSDPTTTEDLLFWTNGPKNRSQAEIDYVIQSQNQIFPIEVKAGKTGRLKSLQIFLEKKHCPLGIRISLNPLSLEKNVLSVPAYMIFALPNLLKPLQT